MSMMLPSALFKSCSAVLTTLSSTLMFGTNPPSADPDATAVKAAKGLPDEAAPAVPKMGDTVAAWPLMPLIDMAILDNPT